MDKKKKICLGSKLLHINVLTDLRIRSRNFVQIRAIFGENDAQIAL